MPTKVTIELDDKVRRALKQAALNLGRPEREITEAALRQFLRLDIVERLGERPSKLAEEDSLRIASEEVHAARRRKARTA